MDNDVHSDCIMCMKFSMFLSSVCQGDENPETSMQIQSDSPHQTNVGVVEMPCCNGDQFNSCSNRNAPTRRIDTDGDSGVSEGDENSRTSEVKNSISEGK